MDEQNGDEKYRYIDMLCLYIIMPKLHEQCISESRIADNSQILQSNCTLVNERETPELEISN